LEVGGGIGAIQLELLKAGAARAVSVELTPTYEDIARQLLDEAGLADRVERKVMDFAQAAAQVDSADVVVLNRVICCYPDMPRLAAAAADPAQLGFAALTCVNAVDGLVRFAQAGLVEVLLPRRGRRRFEARVAQAQATQR